jgi:hypothetical protein
MGADCANHEVISPNKESALQRMCPVLKVSRAVRKKFGPDIARQSGDFRPCRTAATIFYFDANTALPIC